jgi:hypothetical protein
MRYQEMASKHNLEIRNAFSEATTVQIAILSNPWRSRQCTPRSIAAGIYCSAGVWNAALKEPNLQRASIRDCSRSFQGWQVSSRAPSRVCTGSPHDPSNYSCVCMASSRISRAGIAAAAGREARRERAGPWGIWI